MYILCTFGSRVCCFVTQIIRIGVIEAPDPDSDVRFLITITNSEIQYPYSTQKFAYFKKVS